MKKSLYVYNGGQLKKQDNTLRYINETGEKRDLPVETISDIYIMSEMSLNTSLLNLISKQGICLHFFNYYDFYIGSFYPKEQLLAGSLLVKQVEHYSDYEKRTVIAKKFLIAATANIYRNLRYYNGRGKDISSAMTKIEFLRRDIEKYDTIQEIMGCEGNIRRIYYEAWNKIVDQEINFDKRVMHPPDNQINSLISFVNSIVYTTVLTQIYQTQLNPTVSYLHEPGVRRFSLCLDIAEIFKPH